MIKPLAIALFIIVIGLFVSSLYAISMDPFYIAALLVIIPFYIYVELYYRRFSIRIRKTALIIDKGVIIRQHISIPYSKIQNVTVDRGILDHIFGVGKIVIETAGQNLKESEGVIDALRDYDEFVEFLHEKSSLHNKEVTDRYEIEDEFNEHLSKVASDMLKELSTIRKELKKISKYIETEKKKEKTKRGKKK